ncbi:TIGR03826 family flagellar region protein [Heliorestis convoluta]|nr:TIGR03826 family flagellar region protein [Heliorestis convoluta]
MNVKNCPRCDRIFVRQPGARNLCPTCTREEEDQYEVVRTYLRKYPGATVIEVVTATGVEETLIAKFIKEGRLEASSSLQVAWPCERCGTPIRQGNLCGNCQEELAEELRKAAGTLQEAGQKSNVRNRRDRVFTADKDKKM